MFMKTKRLFLRPIWPEDWRDLHGAINDEAVVKNLARVPWPYTADHARDFAGQAQHPRLPHFLVVHPEGAGNDSAETVGGVGLHQEGGDVALGYWVTRHHWGKGFATEAARGLLAIAEVLGHRRIIARHFLDNLASARVLWKLGFCPTGERLEQFSAGRQAAHPAAVMALNLASPGGCGEWLNDGFGMKAGALRAA